MIETKAPILFQPSPGQSSVITAVLLTSKDCFIRLSQKHKIVLYLQMFQHAKLYISASTLFVFLKFCKFQPRYSYKIYILIEKKKTVFMKKMAADGKNVYLVKLGPKSSQMGVRTFARMKNLIWDQLLATKAEIIQS